jgi:hypothetical protein
MASLKESFRHENWCTKVLIKCTKTHIRESVFSEIFPGVIPQTPINREGMRERRKGRKVGKGEGLEMKGVGRGGGRGWDKGRGKRGGWKNNPGFLRHPVSFF